MDFETIDSAHGLLEFCSRLRGAEYVAFDTEFVSENRYRPQLCLVQVATPDSLAIIDAIAIHDLSPFWKLISQDVQSTIAHASREEFLFCFRDFGQRPKNLFDIQLAAGFVGLDYPASYSTLVETLLGKTVAKGETRTDWRVRPLSRRQISYALQDVEYLGELAARLRGQLAQLQRLDWYVEELGHWQTELESTETELQWRRLPGLTRLSRRALAIARQIFQWRDEQARSQERSPRRIIPDDLVVEIAKRGEGDVAKLKAIRGLTQRINERFLVDIAAQVQQALRLPENQLPERGASVPTVSLGLLGQFLATGLGLMCVQQQLAPSLVATTQDIRDLAAWKLGLLRSDEAPYLLSGWRRHVLGDVMDEIIAGKLALRIGDPKSSSPLRLERWPEK